MPFVKSCRQSHVNIRVWTASYFARQEWGTCVLNVFSYDQLHCFPRRWRDKTSLLESIVIYQHIPNVLLRFAFGRICFFLATIHLTFPRQLLAILPHIKPDGSSNITWRSVCSIVTITALSLTISNTASISPLYLSLLETAWGCSELLLHYRHNLVCRWLPRYLLQSRPFDNFLLPKIMIHYDPCLVCERDLRCRLSGVPISAPMLLKRLNQVWNGSNRSMLDEFALSVIHDASHNPIETVTSRLPSVHYKLDIFYCTQA